MDVRSSQLIVVTFLVFAAIVSLVAYLGFRHTIRDAARQATAWEQSQAESSGQPTGRPGGRQVGSSPRQRDPAHEEARTIKRLRELLDRQTETLRRQIDELHETKSAYAETKAEYEQLRADFERLRQQNDWQLASVVTDILQNPGSAIAGTPSTADAEPSAAGAGGNGPTLADVAQASDTELAEAEWELTQSRERVAELELSLLHELERSAKATEAIVATGAAAVPALISVLSDPEPELRRWAATVLGRIGPDAVDAVDSLRQTLRDSDADVVRAARLALDQIEGRM